MERMTLSTLATVSTGGFRTLEPREKVGEILERSR